VRIIADADADADAKEYCTVYWNLGKAGNPEM
jgi:hypothetical protein